MALKILITNNTLDFRAGTELYVRDVALALQKAGNWVAAYSTRLGDVAKELVQAGIPVSDDLSKIPFAPDLIHGQHHMETMCALLHCTSAPAVFFCHGTAPWQEAPPEFPRIYRYVAVDEMTVRRVLDETTATRDRVHMLSNFVDLERFRPRGRLPERPRKAAVFSSTMQADSIPLVQEACSRLEMDLDLLGKVSGQYCDRPEEVLGNYDLILAKGRAALESLAVGTSVLLCDYAAMGPLVASGNLDRLRRFNLGLACIDRPVTVDSLMAEINRYDASDAAQVSARIRSQAGLDSVLESILEVYRMALDEHRQARPDPVAELQAAGKYLKGLSAPLRQQETAIHELERRSDQLLEELDQLNNTFTIRLRNRLLGAPLLGRLIERLIVRKKRETVVGAMNP